MKKKTYKPPQRNRRCRSRCSFGEDGAWRKEDEKRTYQCGLPSKHKGRHLGFEWQQVASWPQK